MSLLTRWLHKLRPRVVVVRRCDMRAWAAQLLPVRGCQRADRAKLCTSTPPSASRLLAEERACGERDTALRTLVEQSSSPNLQLDSELLEQHRSAVSVQARLAAFLGINSSKEVLGVRIGESSHEGREGPSPPPVECATTPPPPMAEPLLLEWAVALLSAYMSAPPPVLAIGVHSDAGGAQAVVKIATEACKAWLSPVMNLRCVFLDDFEACDPFNMDLCLHKQGKFSAGLAPHASRCALPGMLGRLIPLCISCLSP